MNLLHARLGKSEAVTSHTHNLPTARRTKKNDAKPSFAAVAVPWRMMLLLLLVVVIMESSRSRFAFKPFEEGFCFKIMCH